MKGKKIIALVIMVALFTTGFSKSAKAQIFVLNGGRTLDTVFYADYYPDLKAKYGYNTQKLLNHYLDYGIFEGRLPAAIYANNMDLLAIGDVVPCSLLYNRSSLRKKCDEKEFAQAYVNAANMVNGLRGRSRVSQLVSITNMIYSRVTSSVPYNTKYFHYNDPCGVFGCPYAGTAGHENHALGASCAGVTRATGLCLNILAIPYEHVNENTWSHQWCRVNINGVYYIVDPYLNYCGPEKYPYQHPLVPY